MDIVKIKWTHLLLITSLSLLGACRSDYGEGDDTAGTRPISDPGHSDPVKPDPNDPPSAPPPVKVKKKVIIGNHFDPAAVKPKKDSRGYSQFGQWEQSVLSGFKKSISRYSTDVDAYVEYSTNKIGAGKYCVSVYKVSHENSESDTLVEVFENDQLLASKSFDYRTAGGWSHVGEMNFAVKQSAKVKVSRGENSNGGVLRADEVRFLKMKEGFDCFGRKYARVKKNKVLDNKFDPSADKPKRDSAGYRESGEWKQSVLAGFKGSISRYSSDADASVSYSAMVTNSNYCVKVFRVTHPNSAKEVKVSVSQEDQIVDEVIVDYSLAESEKGWIEIGNMNFDKSKPVVVKIEKALGDSGILRADAVKFQSKMCK